MSIQSHPIIHRCWCSAPRSCFWILKVTHVCLTRLRLKRREDDEVPPPPPQRVNRRHQKKSVTPALNTILPAARNHSSRDVMKLLSSSESLCAHIYASHTLGTRPAESESAPNAQLRLSRPLDLLVDPPDLLLGQSSLHVAVDDPVAVAPPPRLWMRKVVHQRDLLHQISSH